MPPVPPEMPPLPPTPPSPPPYQRRYGVFSRLVRILFKPSETMKDIAAAPDYSGVAIILVFQIVLGIVSVALVLSKIEVTGPYADLFRSVFQTVIVAAFAISFILTPVKWLIKSLIVWKVCDVGSQWEFKRAASVTGYAYVANLIVSLVTLPLVPFIFPVIQIDTTNLEAARIWMESYTAQLAGLEFYFTLPTLFVALLWKSYLGGVGTYHGTEEMCKVSGAFFLFFLLGLISVAITLIT